jgi:methylthioribose-1-phosphate isomerase
MRSLDWVDGAIEMVDQTKLPQETDILRIETVPDLVAAIKRLSVRGAPALGVAGAYGVVMAAGIHNPATDRAAYDAAVTLIRDARPTAVNLAAMVDRVAPIAVEDPAAALAEAHLIRNEELQASIAMGDLGADLVAELTGGSSAIRIMTICNTGGLASVERGTALAVIQTVHERGNLAEALPAETRPLLQGGRLTTWELQRMGAPHRLLVDSAAPFLLANGAADVVLIGADRVVANGDTANKIGSFSMALGAAHAGVPFIVVAPESTVDMSISSGQEIEIEDRGAEEVASVRGVPVAPEGTPGINPAFDVTPVSLITALVTDKRIVRFDRGETL